MFSVFRVFLLCGLCSTVMGTTFFWITFRPLEGDPLIADYNTLVMDTFGSFQNTVRYLTGRFIFKRKFDDSTMISYALRQVAGLKNEVKNVTACEFFSGFHQKNLLPMTSKRSNFPPDNGDNSCPLKVGSFGVEEAEKKDDLNAPSELSGGMYTIEVKFIKDDKLIGGYKGRFICYP